MYRCIRFMALGLLCATQALAETTWEKCNANNGGTLVTIGGDTFCKSNSTMNWWSAYAWCQAMDGYMPSIAELCPGKSITDDNACGRTYGDTWSSTTCTSDKVWRVYSNTSMGCGANSVKTKTVFVHCLKKN